jgi:hypothetical protein
MADAPFPQSQAQVDPTFNATVGGLADQAEAQAQAARGQGLRPWNAPDNAGSPLDVPGTTAAFDRAAIDAAYGRAIGDAASPGTVGDCVALKVQSDYVAMMERAYRARHCTPVRLLAMAAARRAGHGQDGGVFRGGVLRYAADALKAGEPQ